MNRNILLTPGPTQIPPQVYKALGQEIIHHRTPQFQNNLKEVFDGLKYVFQTKNEIHLLASSGTGAMEACVCNLLSPGDKAITVDGGKFGERWAEICLAYSAQPKVIKVEWGKAVDPQEIKKALDVDKDIKAVFVTFCETSTAVTTNIKAIAEIVKKYDAVLVVDAVSGLGVEDLQMDNWGVDVVASASHKGFMLPPGLAFVAVSDKAWKLVEKAKSQRYYFDFRKSKEALKEADTAFTPAISLVIGLCESLKMIKANGLQGQFAYYARLAEGTRKGVQALGLSLFTDASCRSNGLTAVNVPQGVDGNKLVKILRDTHGITMAGGQDHVKGKIIRIAHMGYVQEKDIITGISYLEKVLKELGYSFTPDSGVQAANAVFSR